jgi:hypothetical protein
VRNWVDLVKGFDMRVPLIIKVIIFFILFGNNIDAESLNRYGVYISFPGYYTRSGDIGNDNIKVNGVVAETYSLQTDKDLFAVTFLRFGVKPKGTLYDGVKGAVKTVSGWQKDYRYLDINGYSVLESEYSTKKYGPVLNYFERNFYLDKYTLVNVKYMSVEAELTKQGKKFLTSLSIKP